MPKYTAQVYDFGTDRNGNPIAHWVLDRDGPTMALEAITGCHVCCHQSGGHRSSHNGISYVLGVAL